MNSVPFLDIFQLAWRPDQSSFIDGSKCRFGVLAAKAQNYVGSIFQAILFISQHDFKFILFTKRSFHYT